MADEAVLSYEPLGGERHRHRGVEHSHPHGGPHAHGRTKGRRERPLRADNSLDDDCRERDHHGHSHGLIDESIKRSREGLWAVSRSLGVLAAAAIAQTLVFVLTGSIALLADVIHNFGDALTALPLGIAFLIRSARAERTAGLGVVAAIFISACVAGVEAVHRLIHPAAPGHLAVLAAAGAIGYAGNWIAGVVRTHAGRELQSRALIADGAHARADAYVSLAVIASAILVAIGLRIGDPIIGLGMTLVILRITWQSWRTVRGHQHPHH